MDRFIKNIELAFLDILITCRLITDSQLADIYLNLADNTPGGFQELARRASGERAAAQVTLREYARKPEARQRKFLKDEGYIDEQGLFYLLIRQGIISNEMTIELLSNYQILPLLDINYNQIKIQDYIRITHYVREGYVICENNLQKQLVVNDLTQLKKLALNNRDLPIKLIRKKDFYQLLEQNFSHLTIIKAKYFLEFISPSLVAKNINYPKSMLLFLMIYFTILVNFDQFFQIINIICYFLQNILKIILFYQAIIGSREIKFQKQLNKLTLPIYTILLPLYKESNKLKSIIKSIDDLTYPKDKLDVILIIEADDYLLLEEIILTQLPYYIQIIKVPFSAPRTKPKD